MTKKTKGKQAKGENGIYGWKIRSEYSYLNSFEMA